MLGPTALLGAAGLPRPRSNAKPESLDVLCPGGAGHRERSPGVSRSPSVRRRARPAGALLGRARYGRVPSTATVTEAHGCMTDRNTLQMDICGLPHADVPSQVPSVQHQFVGSHRGRDFAGQVHAARPGHAGPGGRILPGSGQFAEDPGQFLPPAGGQGGRGCAGGRVRRGAQVLAVATRPPIRRRTVRWRSGSAGRGREARRPVAHERREGAQQRPGARAASISTSYVSCRASSTGAGGAYVVQGHPVVPDPGGSGDLRQVASAFVPQHQA